MTRKASVKHSTVIIVRNANGAPRGNGSYYRVAIMTGEYIYTSSNGTPGLGYYVYTNN